MFIYIFYYVHSDLAIQASDHRSISLSEVQDWVGKLFRDGNHTYSKLDKKNEVKMYRTSTALFWATQQKLLTWLVTQRMAGVAKALFFGWVANSTSPGARRDKMSLSYAEFFFNLQQNVHVGNRPVLYCRQCQTLQSCPHSIETMFGRHELLNPKWENYVNKHSVENKELFGSAKFHSWRIQVTFQENAKWQKVHTWGLWRLWGRSCWRRKCWRGARSGRCENNKILKIKSSCVVNTSEKQKLSQKQRLKYFQCVSIDQLGRHRSRRGTIFTQWFSN